jgi:hypothetical protein
MHGNDGRSLCRERLMYMVVPLLLALALFMPWTGPADPGNRMAAANSADGLAQQALIYHQAAVAYVRANPNTSGTVTPAGLPAGWTTTAIASCANAKIVVTYVSVPTTISKPAVAAAMGRLWGGFPVVGQSMTSTLTNPYSGLALPFPCVVPDYSPVIYSQAGG